MKRTVKIDWSNGTDSTCISFYSMSSGAMTIDKIIYLSPEESSALQEALSAPAPVAPVDVKVIKDRSAPSRADAVAVDGGTVLRDALIYIAKNGFDNKVKANLVALLGRMETAPSRADAGAVTVERELLPCPFCGGEVELNKVPDNRTDEDDIEHWLLWCDCGVHIPPDTKENQIRAWNTRARLHPAKGDRCDCCAGDGANRLKALGLDDCPKCHGNSAPAAPVTVVDRQAMRNEIVHHVHRLIGCAPDIEWTDSLIDHLSRLQSAGVAGEVIEKIDDPRCRKCSQIFIPRTDWVDPRGNPSGNI